MSEYGPESSIEPNAHAKLRLSLDVLLAFKDQKTYKPSFARRVDLIEKNQKDPRASFVRIERVLIPYRDDTFDVPHYDISMVVPRTRTKPQLIYRSWVLEFVNKQFCMPHRNGEDIATSTYEPIMEDTALELREWLNPADFNERKADPLAEIPLALGRLVNVATHAATTAQQQAQGLVQRLRR